MGGKTMTFATIRAITSQTISEIRRMSPTWRRKRRKNPLGSLEVEKQQARLPVSEGQGADQAPIKPVEPLDNTQSEIPKVGSADAPGG
jgi:hypothetical protein